jgi:hypothetical protein
VHDRSPDPNVLLFVGLAASWAIALISTFYGFSRPETLTLGLLGTVISLLLELFGRFLKFVSDPAELTKVREAIYGSPRLHDFVVTIVADYSRVAGHNDRHFKKYAAAIMDHSQKTFDELANGRYHAPVRVGDEGKDAIEIAQAAGKTLEATSYGSIAKWWASRGGREYLDVNKEAIARRRVKITRIFIVEPTDSQDDVVRIATEQSDVGIDVWVVSAASINGVLRKDYAIADRHVVSAGVYREDGTITPLVIINRDERNEYVENFKRVKRRAKKLDQWASEAIPSGENAPSS